MRIHVLLFGILRDRLATGALDLDLPVGATVSTLLNEIRKRFTVTSSASHVADLLRGIAVSVNEQFATASQPLQDGDEVALLPPVSGGAPNPMKEQPEPIVTALVREPIDTARLIAAARAATDGAVLVFDGIVRNNSRGRRTLFLDYEAYEPMAARQLYTLAVEAISRFDIRHVTLVHRLGRLALGETSVLIAVASAHRAAAYEASRWLIDTLKQTVPIWKRETFEDGTVWAPGEPFPTEIAIAPEAGHDA